MPDHNDPPSVLGDDEFGTIVNIRGSTRRTYKLTALDATMMAIAIEGESRQLPWLPAWALINNWTSKADYVREGMFYRQIQLYCATINPRFMFPQYDGPDGATRPCNTIRFGRSGRGRLLYPDEPRGGRTIQAPPVHPHARGFPVAASEAAWNRGHCRPSESRHNADSKSGVRWRRHNIGRRAFYGSEAERREAWMRIPEKVRKSVWLIFRAEMGNPIPGFDGWAACGGRRRTHIGPMSVSEGLSTITNFSQRGEYIGFQEGGGNCFIYREYQQGDVHIEFRGLTSHRGYAERGHLAWNAGRGGSSRLVSVSGRSRMGDRDDGPVGGQGARPQGSFVPGMRPQQRQRASRNTTVVSSGSTSTPQAAGATQPREITRPAATSNTASTPVTREGLAPTAQRPASSHTGSNYTRPNRLGSPEDIYAQLSAWADTMQTELTRHLGYGRRR